LTWKNGGSPRLLVQGFQCDLGGILFGIVDVLAIIPVTSSDILSLDGNGAGPGSTASCNSEVKTISYPLSKARELKVGVQLMRGAFFSFGFCKTPLLPAMPTHETHSSGQRQGGCVCIAPGNKEENKNKPSAARKEGGQRRLRGKGNNENWVSTSPIGDNVEDRGRHLGAPAMLF
jgi:hypothetical protein